MIRNLLDPRNRELLQQIAGSNVLVAFDFDGTLAPIVREPDEAKLRARTKQLLAAVARQFPCIVMSGRSRADVSRRLRGIELDEIVGNHGIEPWQKNESFASRVLEWLPDLHRRLGALKGVLIEDKIFSVAIHYRNAPDAGVAREAIRKAVGLAQGLRVIGGKRVFNLIPEGAPHKGMALCAARDRLACDTALYVGDDETDEDVFALDDPGRLLTVRVGPKAASRAAFFLPGQGCIDRLLSLLIQLRPTVGRRSG